MSPHKLLNVSSIPSPVLAKAAATLKNATVFRFDGSDLMPAEVRQTRPAVTPSVRRFLSTMTHD